MGLYAIVWGYVYLSFNNNTYVIYLEVIFMCFYVWVLVLVDVFDVWVYSFYNGGYLSGENFGVLAF